MAMESQEWNWSASYNKWDNWQRSQLHMEEEEKRRIEQEKRKSKLSTLRSHTCNSDHTRERELYEMKSTQKFLEANEFKAEGTAFFVEGQYYRAAGQYRRALLYFDYMFPDTEEEEEKMCKMQVFCLLNLAACKLHTGQLKETINFCSQSLQLEPENIKALFRRARAYRQQDLFDKAKKDLTTALSLSTHPPTTKAIRRELALLRQLRSGYVLRQRQMFRPTPASQEPTPLDKAASKTQIPSDPHHAHDTHSTEPQHKHGNSSTDPQHTHHDRSTHSHHKHDTHKHDTHPQHKHDTHPHHKHDTHPHHKHHDNNPPHKHDSHSTDAQHTHDNHPTHPEHKHCNHHHTDPHHTHGNHHRDGHPDPKPPGLPTRCKERPSGADVEGSSRSWSMDTVSVVRDIHADLLRAGDLVSEAKISPSIDCAHTLSTSSASKKFSFSLYRQACEGKNTEIESLRTLRERAQTAPEKSDEKIQKNDEAHDHQVESPRGSTATDNTISRRLLQCAVWPVCLWIVYSHAICPCATAVSALL